MSYEKVKGYKLYRASEIAQVDDECKRTVQTRLSKGRTHIKYIPVDIWLKNVKYLHISDIFDHIKKNLS